jgi:hypothetical protein
MQLHFHTIPICKCTIHSKHKMIKDLRRVKKIGMHQGLTCSRGKLGSTTLDVCGPPSSFGTTSFCDDEFYMHACMKFRNQNDLNYISSYSRISCAKICFHIYNG